MSPAGHVVSAWIFPMLRPRCGAELRSTIGSRRPNRHEAGGRTRPVPIDWAVRRCAKRRRAQPSSRPGCGRLKCARCKLSLTNRARRSALPASPARSMLGVVPLRFRTLGLPRDGHFSREALDLAELSRSRPWADPELSRFSRALDQLSRIKVAGSSGRGREAFVARAGGRSEGAGNDAHLDSCC